MSASRRPTGTTRAAWRTRSTTVRPPVRVAGGRDDAGRLVQQDVGELLRRERAAVELDPVARRDERVELAGLAVHRTRPALISSSAPRRDATPARAR